MNWESLVSILRTRGFSHQWCGWIKCLLQTSLSAVVVNGLPGKWITCKRGLRQGDPISPYLFLIVADVLPALVKNDGSIRHPIASDLPCPILQYADDTLILLPADLTQIQRFCVLLDAFSAATGLKINYSKSTMVPIHVPTQICSEAQNILQCKLDHFPQTYLGLLLSDSKLNLTAFTPLIARTDKHLATWQNQFLNAKGRSVLINSMLDGANAYLMAANQFPKGVLNALDSRRRAFL